VICDEYAAKNSRIVVIHQINKGPAITRNVGVKIAQGEFLVFVDSDDWLEPDALELLYKRQQETDADIVMGGFRSINNIRKTNQYFSPLDKYENVVVYFLLCKHKYLWGKLYKKTLFNDYTVPETNILEDGIVNVQLFSKLKSDKIQIVNEIIYNHDENTNGLIVQLQKQYNYHFHTEFPMIKSCLWIENYLKQENQYGVKEISAFAWFILESGIIPYLRFNKDVSKKEAKYLYHTYYKPCDYLYLFNLKDRMIVLLYSFSKFLGEMYTAILDYMSKMKKYTPII
jgi:glycosyltransferase involved in cell wall biosynthesis